MTVDPAGMEELPLAARWQNGQLFSTNHHKRNETSRVHSYLSSVIRGQQSRVAESDKGPTAAKQADQGG